MFINIFIALLLGIVAGIFTGIVPGMHINLVSVLVLAESPFLLKYTNVVCLAVFLISMSVVHTFLSALPAIFLGAPDSDTALNVLPGHRFLLRGRGLAAVKLNLVGCYGALLTCIVLFPVFIFVIGYIYPYIEKVMGYLLLAIVVFMLLRDSKKLWAAAVFLFSGLLGLIVLNWPNLKDPLFPMFSGMFGVSTLLFSLNQRNKIPKQHEHCEIVLKKKEVLKVMLAGNFSGLVCSLLPGLSTSISAVIPLAFMKNLKEDMFLVLLGSINVFNFVLSMATLYVIDKARNGPVVAVQQLVETTTVNQTIIFLAAVLVSGSIAVFLCLIAGKIFAGLVSKVNYRTLVMAVIALISVLVLLLSGVVGFIVLIVSVSIGILAPLLDIKRTHAMGCLLVPCIVYYLL